MRFILYLIIFVSVTFNAYPQTKLDSLIAIGNEQSFQFRFKQATQTFKNVISDYPNSPLGYYYISRNSLWFYLANKDSVSKAEYQKYFVLAKVKGELEFENKPENPVVNFNMGNIYMLKSIFSSVEQNTMDAFWATKSAVNYFEEAIELDGNYYDPYLGLGTIKYALGFVPGFLGWAISVAGLDGEKSEGLNDVLKAYEKSDFSKVEASYHLGKIYTEYNAEYEKAENHLSNLVELYPMNELFLYQYAILQIDERNLLKARKYLNKILMNNLPSNFHQTYALSLFLKGEISFKENRFKNAIEDYENFIQQTTSIDYTGIANFKIALSFMMLDNNLMAQKHFILARNGNQNIAEDSQASEMSEVYFDKEFSDSDKNLILAQNYLESGKYGLAIEELNKIKKEKIGAELNLQVELVRIESYQLKNNFFKSGEIFSKYKNLTRFNKFNCYSKLLYFKSVQMFHEKEYDKAKEILELAFENLNKHNNKLNRLLVNFNSKLNH
ncbi:MAG: DUF3808 domain-containing protein [Melioribacteraceae bacterium]|nr:DUF3808 domain-containing protein [Melioribacteraceae bacterium]